MHFSTKYYSSIKLDIAIPSNAIIDKKWHIIFTPILFSTSIFSIAATALAIPINLAVKIASFLYSFYEAVVLVVPPPLHMPFTRAPLLL